MSQRTPLYEAHVAAGARMVDFSGWEMPINYGSQIEEHHAVRKAAGMFDVSHMAIVDIGGEHARHFLSYLLANDIDKLRAPGRAPPTVDTRITRPQPRSRIPGTKARTSRTPDRTFFSYDRIHASLSSSNQPPPSATP